MELENLELHVRDSGNVNSLRSPFVREWVGRAQEIIKPRAVATADRVEADPEFDELIARFRLDRAALN